MPVRPELASCTSRSPALEGMLETLVARGRLRAIEFVDDGCGTCPVKGGCFIMNDGVAKTYALPPDHL